MIIYQQPQPSAEPDFIYLGFGTSFDVKSKFSGYASLTADDFYIKEVSDYSTSRGSIQTYADGTINREGKIVKSYNALTGTLTCYARFYYRASDSNGTGDKVDEHINCECFLRRPTATNQMIDLGTNTSFNVSSVYSNYANLTVDNFCVESSEVYSASRGTIWGYPDGSGIRRQMRLEKSYNAQTGVLTCYLLYYYQANDSNGTGDKVNQQIKVNVFLSDVELVSEEAPNYSKEISDVKMGSSQIQTVMLGDKELWGGKPQKVSGTFADTAGVKLTLELDLKAKAFVRTTTKSSGVTSVLSHDVILEYSDDNSAWHEVANYHTQYTTANPKCYAVSNTKHKYWRVRFNGGNNQGNQEVILGNEKAMADVDFSGYTRMSAKD